MSTPISIEDLYKCFGILADAKEQAGQHEDTYLTILSGTKMGTKEKQLACQFITRFFKYFPKQMPLAIEAIFDLVESDDAAIRKSAIKDLSVVCKECSEEHLSRIADILTQLLQTEDQQEFSLVQSSLFTVFKQNPKCTLHEIFNQINTAELETVRKGAIRFLVAKVPTLFEASAAIPAVGSKDLEDLLVKCIKQALTDVDAEEFILFIRMLTALPSMGTLTGRQDLVNIILSQSEIDKQFDAADTERLIILLSCIQQAIPLFSKNVQSTKYVHYLIVNVLSVFKQIADESIRFEILKSLADLCVHYNLNAQSAVDQTVVSSCSNYLTVLYELLIDYLPKPPVDTDESSAEAAAVSVESGGGSEDAKFNFSYVECLLLAFHALAKCNAEFLATSDDESSRERLRDLRLRLTYFAKGTQNYIKELRNLLLATSSPLNSKPNEEDKIRRVALKVTTNIDSLIKDFFHNPPVYKTAITASWRVVAENQSNQAKRALSVDNGNEDSARKKPERGIYQPPSGKYSTSNSANENGNGSGNPKRRTHSYGTGAFRNKSARHY